VNRDGGWHDSITGIGRRTLQAAYEDNIPFLAGALSFDLLLTTIPFIVLLLAVAGYLVHHQITTYQVSLHELLVRFVPNGADSDESGAFSVMEKVLTSVLGRRGRLTVFGLPLFLWFSTRLFGGLRTALNEVFDTDERRPWHVGKLLDLFLVCVAGLFLIANGVLSAYQASNADKISHNFLVSWVWRLSVETIAFGLGIGMFYLVFKLLPSRRINWRTALVAAAFCSLGFEVAKWIYAFSVARFVTFDQLATDANAVALFLFLLWVYYTAFLFLLGGEVAETYDLIRMRRAQRVRLG
jgi:membrane protein